jgi:hypothetical protein
MSDHAICKVVHGGARPVVRDEAPIGAAARPQVITLPSPLR